MPTTDPDPSSFDRLWAEIDERPQRESARTPPGFRWIWLVWSLIPTIVILSGAELLLHALGVEEAPLASWSRGFDRRESYLVPAGGGAYVTRIFDVPAREVHVPPKGDARRVVLFGGSNTAGFPGDHLRERLDVLEPGRSHEVVNLGREGYGSQRVAILVEQAMVIQPDVVVLYTGHNEFVEYSFTVDLEGGTPLMPGTSWLGRLRTFRWLVSWFTPRHSESDGSLPLPSAWAFEHDKFRGQTHAAMLRRLETYRENLRSMCRSALASNAQVVLCTLIGNHWISPASTAFLPERPQATRDRVESILADVPAMIPESLRPVLGGDARDVLHAVDWRHPARSLDPERIGTFLVPPLRSKVGPPHAGAWAWPPPEVWSDRVVSVLNAFTWLHRGGFTDDQRGELYRARKHLLEARALAPEHASVLYELAVLEEALGGADDVVRSLLHAAADGDTAPRRATPRINRIVREVAAEFPHVELLDLEARFAARGCSGVFGWEWMMDVCHLHMGARRALLDLVAEAIVP